MTVPAYHMRPNKAADRLALMEAIRRLARLDNDGLTGYTYHGLGGPYLEDFRLLYDLCPEIGMVSIEKDADTIKRQEFHLPCSYLKLENKSMSSFITNYDPGNDKSIFWLDYTKLEYVCFMDFQRLLVTVAYDSMIKITLRSEPRDFYGTDNCLNEKGERFHEKFGDIMPGDVAAPPGQAKEFAALLQHMVQTVAQRALRAEVGYVKFIPVSSFYYFDGTWMFTLTGIVCSVDKEDRLKKAFKDWNLVNMEWSPPRRINVPALSTKERLHLQPLLPAETPETTLHERLGYSIGKKTVDQLKQYAEFYRYAPYFIKGMP